MFYSASAATPKKLALPTGLPIGGVNAYYFEFPTPTLIDTGLKSHDALAALGDGLHRLGASISALQRVIISHEHVDHFGLAAILAEKTTADFFIFEPTIPILTDYDGYWSKRMRFYTHYLFPKLGLTPEVVEPLRGYYDDVKTMADSIPENRVTPFGAGECFELGDAQWTALHVPGHCTQLICFHQPETKQLLSTDMLLSQTPTPIIDPPTDPAEDYIPALPVFLQSLEKINALPLETIYPGHGDIFSTPYELIARQKARIERRKLECLTLIQSGITTIEPLLLSMYPHYPPRYRFAALWMLVGYLDLLRNAGHIIRTEKNGVWHFEPV